MIPFFQAPFRAGCRYWVVLALACTVQAGFLGLIAHLIMGEHVWPWPMLWRRSVAMGAARLLIYHGIFRWMSQRRPGWRLLPVLLAAAVIDGVVDLGIRHLFEAPFEAHDAYLLQDGERSKLSVQAMFWPSAIICGLLQYGTAALLFYAWHSWRERQALAAAMREAQLAQLQSQLHPHFLFNALNSIRAMMFEDRDRAADMLTSLADLLRSSLRQHEALGTLDADWALASDYLGIESARFEQRLGVQCRLPDALRQERRPAFTLLTLCENAIKHGIAVRPEGGMLAIDAQIQGDDWQLQVRNPLGTAAKASEGLGLGLQNLAERLRLQLGPQARLQAVREQGHFVVTLTLPRNAICA